ncbi:MAG: M56 family metallopeptidase [Pirellulales bacterium]
MTSVLALVASNAIIAAILALLTVIATRFWRSPQLAHGLWLLVLLKLITPPVLTVSPPSEWFEALPSLAEPSPSAIVGAVNEGSDVGHSEFVSPPESEFHQAASNAAAELALAESPAAGDRGSDPSAGRRDSDVRGNSGLANRAIDFASAYWLTVVSIVWTAGALAYLSLLVWRCVCFRRVLFAAAEAGVEIIQSATRLASKLGLRRCPQVHIVDAPVPPLVWSLGLRPLVVLPSKLLAELSPAQREALIAHELAHVRRRDYLIRWLEVFALVLWWWNPVAWFARRKLREAEEECCDAWVVWALPGARRSYGEAMLATIEFLTDVPKLPALAESAFGSSSYKRRIEMIMKRNMNCRMSWAALAMVLLLAIAVLPVVAQTSTTTSKESGAQPPDAAAATVTISATDPVEAASDVLEAGKVPSPDPFAQADKAPDKAGDQAPSAEALLKRISRLEQLLQGVSDPERPAREPKASEPRDALLRQMEELQSRGYGPPVRPGANRGGLPPASTAPSRLPDFEVSSDEREQQLQERLLKLDVQAAQAEVEQARTVHLRSFEANKNTPRAVSDIEVRNQFATLRYKEIQLQRAETVVELFKRQVQRKRDAAARAKEQRSSTGTAKTRQLVEASLAAKRAEEFARVKELNQQTANEVLRLEKLLKESPESPETWQAVDEFLQAYRKLREQDAKADVERQRFPAGFAN